MKEDEGRKEEGRKMGEGRKEGRKEDEIRTEDLEERPRQSTLKKGYQGRKDVKEGR